MRNGQWLVRVWFKVRVVGKQDQTCHGRKYGCDLQLNFFQHEVWQIKIKLVEIDMQGRLLGQLLKWTVGRGQ